MARDKNGIPVIDPKTGEPKIVGKVVPTKTGLAYHLGFSHRNSLMLYQEYPEFQYVVACACLRCEAALAEQLFNPNGYKAARWMLVTNYGWSNSKGADTENRPIVAFVNPDGSTVQVDQHDVADPQMILNSPMSRVSLK